MSTSGSTSGTDQGRPVWRLPVIAVVVAALVGAVLVDRSRPASEPVDFGRPAAADMPVAPPGDALTSTAYCPGVPSRPDGSRTGTITILNPGDVPVTGTLTLFASNSFETLAAGQAAPAPPPPQPARVEPITVPERDRRVVELNPLIQATPVHGDYVAALVEMRGGDVIVEQATITASGTRPTPCATSAAGTWYTADGSTTLDADLRLLVFNPFPESAIVDFTFATNEGTRKPQALQGYPVPPLSLRAIRLTDEVLRKQSISVAASTRSGRIVLGRFQTFDGSGPAGRQGVVTGLAASSAGVQWWFADGEKGPGVDERFALFNPSEDDAEVSVALYSGDPAVAGIPPIELTLGPESAQILDIGAQSDDAVPPGRHMAIVTSDNGVPIVVERVLDTTAEGRRGTTSVFGARLVSGRWAFAAGAGDDAGEYLTVANPTGAATSVAIQSVGPAGVTSVLGYEAVPLAPAGNVQIDVKALGGPGIPLVVSGAGSVVAERSFYTPDAAGATAIMGIPTLP